MLKVNFIKESEDAIIPTISKEGSACFDFFSIEDIEIPPGGSAKIENGIRVIVPENYFLTFSTRSSMGFMKDLFVYPGILDAGWKGNLAIKLYNFGENPIRISKGDKYAQGRFEKVTSVEFLEISFEEFEQYSCRGGWGSTGK
jgi:dUTP pyrophosphatase